MSAQALTLTGAISIPKFDWSAATDSVTSRAHTRSSLLDVAYQRILEYRRAARASEAALGNAWLALSYFVTESGATPQVGLDGENGVEVEWLVNGRSLVVNAMADGTNVVWGLDESGTVPFRAEFAPKSMARDHVITVAERFLADLSQGVVNRVAR